MKPDWNYETLGDLCDIQIGKTPARRMPSYWDATHTSQNVWLSVADLAHTDASHQVFDSKEYLSSDGAKASKLVSRGTLLVSFKLTLGRLAIAGKDLYTNEAIAALLIREPGIISRDFLFYFLQFFDWVAAAKDDIKLKGMTLNKAKLRKIVIPLPPLDEQKRIVAILDQAFAGIDKAIAHTEKNLANARELFEGCLNTTFRDLNDRCAATCLTDSFNVKSSKRVLKSQWRDKGVPFYRGREITKLAKHGGVNNDLFISEELFREFREQHGAPAPGDIMVTAIGTIGNSYIVKGSDRFYFKDASVLWLDKITDIDSSFANYWLQSNSFHEQLKKDNGATVDTLTIGTLKTTRIPVPSVVEQGNTANMLDAIKDQTDHLELVQRRKLTALANLKQSLLHKAFSGELTADPERETEAALP